MSKAELPKGRCSKCGQARFKVELKNHNGKCHGCYVSDLTVIPAELEVTCCRRSPWWTKGGDW